MRIEKITLRDFRGVKESAVEFSPGVTIVAGPNEVGKSSIADAIRLLRTMKHSSRAGPIRSLQPVGKDVGPEVELEFTSRGHHVWVRKQWLRDAATELRISGAANEQLSGDQAHERLNSFLSEMIDVDLFDALEVVQGSSLERAELVGLRSLTQALDTSSAPVADHDELIEKIEAEYDQHFTKTGRPKGRYQQLSKDVEELQLQLHEAREKSREMDQFTAEVERANAQLAADEADLVEAKENLEEHQAQEDALTGLREAVKNAQTTVENSTTTALSAQKALDARAALQAEVQEREQALAAATEALTGHEEQISALKVHGEELSRNRDAARASRDEARRLAADAAKAVDRAVDHHELASLGARLRNAQSAQSRRLEAAQTIANCHVDAELLEQISARGADLQIARGAQEAAAARIHIQPLDGGVIEANGEDVTDERDILVTRPVVVEAPGVVRVEVNPGVLPEDLHETVREAEDALAELLRRGEVDTVEEARAVSATRAEAEAEQKLAAEALATALGESTLEELQEEQAVILARLGEPESGIGEHDAGEQIGEAHDLLQLRKLATEATGNAEQHETALDTAQSELDSHTTKLADLRATLIRAQADRDNHAAELKRAAHALGVAREEIPDDDLAKAVAAAQRDVADAKTAQQEADARLAAANPEAVEIELANAKEWVENAGTRQNDTRDRLRKFTALLEDRAKLGLYDEAKNLEGELQTAQHNYNSVHRRAEAVRLLHEVMLRHRDEAHARYVTPFAERIESLGRIVFGSDFKADITPDLHIANRTLDGQTVPFESLSAGAQEQLGLLGRLAAAALVDPVEGAPLILDDTLGFADDDRLGSLGAVLNDVGKNSQIIVLTCQPRRFSRVGGAKMVHLTAS